MLVVMSSLRRLMFVALLLVCTVLSAHLPLHTLHAQERTSAQPMYNPADTTDAALLQKISYQSQVISVLQEQLRAARTGQSTSATLPKSNTEDFATHQVQPETGTGPCGSTHTTYNTPSTPATPPPAYRRTTGVYQQPTETRLTCDDYSLSYFRRHPAMATVCGINPHQSEISSTTVSATTSNETSAPPQFVSVTQLLSATNHGQQ